MKDLIGENETSSQYIKAGKIAEISLNQKDGYEKVICELQHSGFFTMCYPHIFVNGSCDFTVKGLRNLNYDEWVEHIYYNVDNRVASDPFLKFHLMNIGLKQKALNQGSYCVSQQINDSLITVEELKSRLESGDDSIARTIISHGGNLLNTDPYWKARKVENHAMNFYFLYREDMLLVWFDTSSCVEHHWKALHRLIVKLHAMIHDSDEADVWQQFNSNSAFKHKLVAQNGHIVTNYFHVRNVNYKNTVLKELYDWTDLWGRDEFAKSLGQIHDHSIIYSKTHNAKVQDVMKQDVETLLKLNYFKPGFNLTQGM